MLFHFVAAANTQTHTIHNSSLSPGFSRGFDEGSFPSVLVGTFWAGLYKLLMTLRLYSSGWRELKKGVGLCGWVFCKSWCSDCLLQCARHSTRVSDLFLWHPYRWIWHFHPLRRIISMKFSTSSVLILTHSMLSIYLYQWLIPAVSPCYSHISIHWNLHETGKRQSSGRGPAVRKHGAKWALSCPLVCYPVEDVSSRI